MVKFPCITGRCVIRNVTWSDTVARSDHSTFQNVAPSMAFAYTTSDRRMQFYLCQRVSGVSIAAMSVSRITQVVDKLKWIANWLFIRCQIKIILHIGSLGSFKLMKIRRGVSETWEGQKLPSHYFGWSLVQQPVHAVFTVLSSVKQWE